MNKLYTMKTKGCVMQQCNKLKCICALTVTVETEEGSYSVGLWQSTLIDSVSVQAVHVVKRKGVQKGPGP